MKYLTAKEAVGLYERSISDDGILENILDNISIAAKNRKWFITLQDNLYFNDRVEQELKNLGYEVIKHYNSDPYWYTRQPSIIIVIDKTHLKQDK